MTKKAIVWIVIIIIILGIIILFTRSAATDTNTVPASPATATEQQPVMTPPSDTSNQAMQQDMTSIDAQMNGLDQDNAQADQSLNNPNQ